VKILFLTSEITPFSRTSEAGDLARSLSKAVKGLGHEIRMVTPRYKSIRERRYGLRDVARLRSLQIAVGDKIFECSVKSGFVVGSKVQVYFLDCPGLYEAPQPDGGCRGTHGKVDSHLAFALLSHGALQLTQMLNWMPDIIHCNGWQAALAPYLVKRFDQYQGSFDHTRAIVQTQQCDSPDAFPVERASEIGFDQTVIETDGPLICGNNISFLKAGLSMADMIISSNPQLVTQLETAETSDCSLIRVINDRGDEIRSVKRGIELAEWDPSSDRKIACQFDSDNIHEGKSTNKTALQARLNLNVSDDLPVIAVLTRFVDDQEIELLKEMEECLFTLPAQVVITGACKPALEKRLQSWVQKFPGRIAVDLTDGEASERQTAAGADMFLLPSHGDNLKSYLAYIMKYGAVAVVNDDSLTARDMVVDYRTSDRRGNGFLFTASERGDMLSALKRAVDLYNDTTAWGGLRSRVMDHDFSWSGVAEEYIELYNHALSRPPYSG